MKFPQPVFFGIEQEEPKTRIAFLGDSITQGLGTATGKYEFWTSKIADKLQASDMPSGISDLDSDARRTPRNADAGWSVRNRMILYSYASV